MCQYILFFFILLSSDIRSEGSIATVKKILLPFFMVFDSISLPHSNSVSETMSRAGFSMYGTCTSKGLLTFGKW